MSLPGFTAEAALQSSRLSDRYRALSYTGAESQKTQTVVPQVYYTCRRFGSYICCWGDDSYECYQIKM
jgi:hypothetical protein